MAESIIEIAAADLHDSPTNPRKTYSKSYLQELAANIKGIGRILQPLLVRPRIPELFAGDPEAAAGYEIVFGHCRKRAGCDIAGLPTAPCMVRSMTDAEVEAAQISENLQRLDVHPIEEAEGFAGLIERHGETADSLAIKYGKSTSHIYGRLSLLKLAPDIRAACLAGEIDATAAGLFGRLRVAKLQTQALSELRRKGIDEKDGGKRSFRQVRDFLNDRYTLALDKTPFDQDDAELVPAAGACSPCPKRTGNAPEFSDIANDVKQRGWLGVKNGPNVCTDPDCFAAKKTAQLKRQADALTAAGQIVVDGTRARNSLDAVGNAKGAYISVNKVRHALQDAKKAAAKGKAEAPVIYTLQDPRDGKTYQAVKRADLVKAGVWTQDQLKPPPAPTRTSDDYARERREREAHCEAVTAEREAKLTQVRSAVASSARSLPELRVVIVAMLETIEEDEAHHIAELWGCKGTKALADDVATMAGDDLARMLIDFALVQRVRPDPWGLDEPPRHLDALASLHGLTPGGGQLIAGTVAPEEGWPAMAGSERAPLNIEQEVAVSLDDSAAADPVAQPQAGTEWNPALMDARARRTAADEVGDHERHAHASEEAP